jgi:hypothetical protein
MLDQDHETLKALVAKRYKLFMPLNAKDLRIQYPEFKEYPEFASSKIKTHDLLFVWWFSCVTSPYYDEPDEKKVDKCIDLAYATDRQKEAKREEFLSAPGAAPRFPDSIKQAIRRMESFNLSARAQTMEAIQNTMENCKKVLNVDVDGLDPERRKEWFDSAPKMWKLMEEAIKAAEKGSYGVTEEYYAQDETVSDDGAIRDYRNSRNL